MKNKLYNENERDKNFVIVVHQMGHIFVCLCHIYDFVSEQFSVVIGCFGWRSFFVHSGIAAFPPALVSLNGECLVRSKDGHVEAALNDNINVQM